MKEDQIKEALRLADELTDIAPLFFSDDGTLNEIERFLRALAASAQQAEPRCWERVHSDGTPTGEYLHPSRIEEARKQSGAWVPLYTRPPAAQVQLPPIKGAWIDRRYVIVTPARGTDPKALKAAIIEAAAAPAAPVEAQVPAIHEGWKLAVEKLRACDAVCDRVIENGSGVWEGVDFYALKNGIAKALAAAPAAPQAEQADCCGDPAQCWEPCGGLGKSAEHAEVVHSFSNVDDLRAWLTGFDEWADGEFGPSSDAPQRERFASYWRCWQAAKGLA